MAPLFDAYRQFYEQAADLARARQFIQERLANEQSVVFLALMDGDDGPTGMGFVQLYPTFSSISLKPMWILNDLFVTPDARKQGVGRALMDRAKQLALETNALGLTLETAIDNTPAQRLYEQLGYEREEEFYTYYLAI